MKTVSVSVNDCDLCSARNTKCETNVMNIPLQGKNYFKHSKSIHNISKITHTVTSYLGIKG